MATTDHVRHLALDQLFTKFQISSLYNFTGINDFAHYALDNELITHINKLFTS